MCTISIIIVHYNTEEFTKQCLASLEKIDQKNKINVVLVDNASTKPFSYQSKLLDLHIIRSETNTGFTGGNNIGIKYAFDHHNPDYILLLNSDTVVAPDFINHLVDFAQAQQKVGTVSPKMYFEKGYEFHKHSYTDEEKGKVIWFAGGSIDWKNMYTFHRGVDEVDRGQFDLEPVKRSSDQMPYFGYQTMDFASGCCILFPTKILKEVGLFDESYFAYWEDVDLSVRISKAGYSHYFCPDAVIWHKNAGSSGGPASKFQLKLQKQNRLKFAMKYASVRAKLALLKSYLLNRT